MRDGGKRNCDQTVVSAVGHCQPHAADIPSTSSESTAEQFFDQENAIVDRKIQGAAGAANGGGAKGPDFWCAYEDGEVRVIGENVTTPDKWRCCAPCKVPAVVHLDFMVN
jgi:hypothetical protein